MTDLELLTNFIKVSQNVKMRIIKGKMITSKIDSFLKEKIILIKHYQIWLYFNLSIAFIKKNICLI